MLILAAAAALAVPPVVPDKFVPAEPENMRLWGAAGDRMKANLAALLKTDEDALLTPYEKRPGADARSGFAVGQFLEAAAGAYRYQKEQRLRVLMERVAKRLLAAQAPNGYLGTYAEAERWTSYDVATHASNLRGLLAYARVSGDERAVAAAKRVGDLLVATFGPEKRDIIASSAASGWSGTGVLGGVMQLFAVTGDAKLLDFARYLADLREPVMEQLLNEGTLSVDPQLALPTLIGWLELFRYTGDETLLQAASAAHEALGQQSPSAPWAEFNWQLLRLTGEARYAGEIEGAEPALLPQLVAGLYRGGVALEHYPEGTFVVPGPAGKRLRFEVARGKEDSSGAVRVTFLEGEGRFPLWLRLGKSSAVMVGEKKYAGRAGRYLRIHRKWAIGDVVELTR